VGSDRLGSGRRTDRTGREVGSTLLLFPVAVLIVLGLGAVVLDTATVFLGQRRLADLAASVANDVVAGIELASFYDPDRELRLDPSRAVRRLDQLERDPPQDRGLAEVRCEVSTARVTATVRCSAVVRPVLAPLWPGAPAEHRVHAVESAVGVRG
jgi:hypothetical protein